MSHSTHSATSINEKIFEAAESARKNPYVQKLIEDEELRENAISALRSARKAFDRASKKGWDKELAKDKQLRRTVEDALDSIKEARAGLAEAPKQAKMRHKRHSLGKLLVIAIVGAVIALALSEDLRKKVLDALFGAEEDFQYSSSTGTNSSTSTSTNGSS